jgi:DNA-binding transcriptional LysR family regulator
MNHDAVLLGDCRNCVDSRHGRGAFAGGVEGNADILRTAALSGLGIALLPSWAVGDDLRSGALTRILPGWEPSPSEVYAVYPSNRLMSAKVRAFVDHLARRIGRMPYWDKEL